MLVLDNLADAKAALGAVRLFHGQAVPQATLDRLALIENGRVPPEWAVHGFEALFAAYDALPAEARDICRALALLTDRDGFYAAGQSGRAADVAAWIAADLAGFADPAERPAADPGFPAAPAPAPEPVEVEQ